MNAFFQGKFLDSGYAPCVDWALTELENGSTDKNVTILAGLNKNDYWEIKKYIEYIIGFELVDNNLNNENWAGKHIVELANKFNNKEMTIHELDEIIGKLYHRLNYPTWLTILSRNCEYANDIKVFEMPFQQELEYIRSLWEKCNTTEEFYKEYDRNISNMHDIKTT
jgi:hypothetical protein